MMIPAIVFILAGSTYAQDNSCDATVESGDAIQDAIDEASPGETICVETGNYSETVNMHVDGITLIPADDASPALVGSTAATLGISIQASDITISGFNFELYVNAIYQEEDLEDISGLVIENNSFRNVEHGITIFEPDDVHIHNNTFRSPSGDIRPRTAIDLRRRMTGVTVSGNQINEWYSGISTNSAGRDTELHIYGNVIRDSPFRGTLRHPISIESTQAQYGDVIVEDNEFYGNESRTGNPADIYIAEAHNTIIRENLHRASESGAYWIHNTDNFEVRNNDIDLGGQDYIHVIIVGGRSTNGMIAENEIRGITRQGSHSGYGIKVGNLAHHTQIVGNEIREVSYGFRIEADSAFVADNTIEDTRRIAGDGRVFPLPGFRIDDGSSNIVENTTINGVPVEGTFHRWEVQEHSMVFEDAGKLSDIDEPIDRPDDYSSAGVYLYFDYFNLEDNRAEILLNYGDSIADTTDLQVENLRAMIYNYDFEQWEVIPYPNGINSDEEHVYARVTDRGTVGFFELGDIALAYGDFEIDDHILAGYDTFPMNVSGMVSNVGVQSGTYEIELLVDDEVVKTKQATVDGEWMDSLSMTHIMPDAGTFEVTVRTDDVVILVEEVEVLSPTADEEERQTGDRPTEFVLEQNYPNPFNPATNIRFGLPEGGQVQLIVYDLLGRRVATLVDGFRDSGYHDVVFDAGHLSSGMYIYKISTNGHEDTGTMLLVK